MELQDFDYAYWRRRELAARSPNGRARVRRDATEARRLSMTPAEWEAEMAECEAIEAVGRANWMKEHGHEH